MNRYARFRSVALLSLFLTALVVVVVPDPGAYVAPTDRHIRIDARSFEYAPAVVDINPGDRVTIELVAQDVVHGLYLDGYNLNVTSDPGQPGQLTFVADRTGTFRFRCSVTCGALHPFMIGKLSVGTNWLFWRAIALAALAVAAGLIRGWPRRAAT